MVLNPGARTGIPVPDAGFGRDRTVGRLVSVSNYRVSVLLDAETRSQVRSYPHNIAIITQIGGYLLFPVSPGVFAVGIIVGASEDEAIEPDSSGVMTLQLARARRVLRLNLLGQMKLGEPFVPGVSIYPTLDTPALLPTEKELESILSFQPAKAAAGKDRPITVGLSPIYGQQGVTASYNDLLSRPVGIVGNTGSGKSCSVARIIQEALADYGGDGRASQAKFIVLDINGEYSNAFGSPTPANKELNAAYLNGQKFHLPLWAFNLTELTAFFEASQASQVPVLERVVTEIRENTIDQGPGKVLRRIVRWADTCNSFLDTVFLYLEGPTNAYCGDKLKKIVEHLRSALEQLRKEPPYTGYVWPTHLSTTSSVEMNLKSITDVHNIPPQVVSALTPLFEDMRVSLNDVRSVAITTGGLKEVTADSPVPFECRLLLNDEYFTSATARFRGQDRMQEYLSTLRLRIHRQVADKRWCVFTESAAVDMEGLVTSILAGSSNVAIIDCSMLSHDVLPCFCAVMGRVLLDLRVRTEPTSRTAQPFVIVLEEAHNYLRPARQDESWGVRLARDAFERISKEGRKFGLSLVIASQRPSDVSPTVLSQCANFLIHRIQNPEDIEYFKRILPLGSRDLLDQLPILAPGEGLLMGSAVNVPTRVRVRKPAPAPQSETSTPWQAWQAGEAEFEVKSAVSRWLADTIASPAPSADVGADLQQETCVDQESNDESASPSAPYVPDDDDVPF